MKRIISLTVLNQAGVLNRITGLFSKRDFNIESITVGQTETEGVSRMTLIVNVQQENEVEQITKQLNKQIDVLKVTDITAQSIVSRELALIKVMSTPATRMEIQGLIQPFRATVIDVSRESVVVQVTGESEKIEVLIDLLKPYGLKEIARTGTTAFTRGTQRSSKETPISIV
ncbi:MULTISPECIES: acetolactate synthase small subunit [Metabacillus]|uniref:Acetolactate synthase small subunit n=1 Tax=Metabacillus rhizolycopersici TaxID=2875709 RepID=A0ABS7UM97_9BACI|nr:MULTISPECIES: acetolactate synthase small subunit [Metabacillus]MBZ5749435.1 acetolactate synthase small subunit [Metabacillus rhizolycopersici]MCM3650661.1 acetolactate synthase small subunit [Metabacillus litoralis]